MECKRCIRHRVDKCDDFPKESIPSGKRCLYGNKTQHDAQVGMVLPVCASEPIVFRKHLGLALWLFVAKKLAGIFSGMQRVFPVKAESLEQGEGG